MADSSSKEENLQGDAALARPYARAIFELAKSQGSYQSWSDSLALMAAVVSNATMHVLLDSPQLTRSGAADLVIRACGEDIGDAEKNLLMMLAENDRLSQLPMIAALYNRFRDEAAGSVEAEVISALPLSEAQKTAIRNALKQRLGRDDLGDQGGRVSGDELRVSAVGEEAGDQGDEEGDRGSHEALRGTDVRAALRGGPQATARAAVSVRSTTSHGPIPGHRSRRRRNGPSGPVPRWPSRTEPSPR